MARFSKLGHTITSTGRFSNMPVSACKRGNGTRFALSLVLFGCLCSCRRNGEPESFRQFTYVKQPQTALSSVVPRTCEPIRPLTLPTAPPPTYAPDDPSVGSVGPARALYDGGTKNAPRDAALYFITSGNHRYNYGDLRGTISAYREALDAYARVDQTKVLSITAEVQDEMLFLGKAFVEMNDWPDARRTWRIYGPPIYGVSFGTLSEQRRFLKARNYRGFFRSVDRRDSEEITSTRDQDQDWITLVHKAIDDGSRGNLKRATYELRSATVCDEGSAIPQYLLGGALYASGKPAEARAAWVVATTERAPSDIPGTGEINWRATRMLLEFYP